MLELSVIVWRDDAPFDALSDTPMNFTNWDDQDRMGRYLEYAAPFAVVVETYWTNHP